MEIPAGVKRRLGLDERRSWAIVTDVNVFTWPGVDVRPAPNVGGVKWEYGRLPPRLLEDIMRRIKAAGTLRNATRRTS